MQEAATGCVKEMRGYWTLEEEALGRTVWRTRFGRGMSLS
jgi:hypothetical protein